MENTSPVADTAVQTTAETTADKGTEISLGGKTDATDTQIAQALAELGDGDFEKLLPMKGEDGTVQKIKVKDLVKEVYSNRTKAKRAQEAVEDRVGSTVKELVAYAKQNPKDFMSRIGINPEEFAEMTLTEKVKALEMTPEQKKLAEYEAKFKKYETQEEERRRAELKTKEEQTYTQEIQRLDSELAEAFTKSGLPRSKFYLQQATAIMLNDLTRYQEEVARDGFASRDPLSAEEALGIIKESVPKLIKESLSSMELNQLRELLGTDLLNKIREDDIKRVQNQNIVKQPSTGTPTKKEKAQVFTKDSDYRDWVESRKR